MIAIVAIAAVWTALMALIVGVCRAARAGEQAQLQQDGFPPPSVPSADQDTADRHPGAAAPSPSYGRMTGTARREQPAGTEEYVLT
jgi:hypothetical protein